MCGDGDPPVWVVGQGYAELLVELVAVRWVGFGKESDEIAECFAEYFDLGFCEFAAGHGAAELGLERFAFAFDFVDPAYECSNFAVGVFERVVVAVEAAVTVGDLVA